MQQLKHLSIIHTTQPLGILLCLDKWEAVMKVNKADMFIPEIQKLSVVLFFFVWVRQLGCKILLYVQNVFSFI